MAEEPRKRPRPPRDRDESGDEKRNRDPDAEPYRLRDDEAEAAPRRRPRPVRGRDDDDEEDRPRRRRIRRRDEGDDEPDDRPRKRSLSVAEMDFRVKATLWGVGILLVLIVLAGVGAFFLYRTTQTSQFKPFMAQYLSAPVGASPGNASHVVVAKMVVVDTTTKDVDWDVFFALPDDLRAAKPQDVGTIVWTNWNKSQIDSYDNGAPAYQWTCKVTVIDRKSRTILWDPPPYRGTEPPMQIDASNGEGVGTKPTDQVLDYLKNLPKG